MEILKSIGLVVFLVAFHAFVFGRRWFVKEIERNEKHEPPSDQQLRWDIRHMREDLHAVVMINYALTVVIVGILLFRL